MEKSPRKATELQAKIRPNSISGHLTKAIFVETNTPKQRLLRLTLSGRAIPLLKVYPKNTCCSQGKPITTHLN
ncbi:MAG: hypothetical protein GY750_14605 [Lentisphaerae bacterium]|nr:hypothetical protein [Lentisphaerota bacterium]